MNKSTHINEVSNSPSQSIDSAPDEYSYDDEDDLDAVLGPFGPPPPIPQVVNPQNDVKLNENVTSSAANLPNMPVATANSAVDDSTRVNTDLMNKNTPINSFMASKSLSNRSFSDDGSIGQSLNSAIETTNKHETLEDVHITNNKEYKPAVETGGQRQVNTSTSNTDSMPDASSSSNIANIDKANDVNSSIPMNGIRPRYQVARSGTGIASRFLASNISKSSNQRSAASTSSVSGGMNKEPVVANQQDTSEKNWYDW
jgi:hypothetical protein